MRAKSGKFSSSHQFPHVGGSWLGRVDPSSLLSPGHPPPQLVVSLQDGRLGIRAQLSELCLAGTGGGGSLVVVNIILHTSISTLIGHNPSKYSTLIG